MRRYRFHLIGAVLLSTAGLVAVVSVHAQHPQNQPYGQPGLFQQIRTGLLGAPNQGRRGPTPAPMPQRTPMRPRSMQGQRPMPQPRDMPQGRPTPHPYGTPYRGVQQGRPSRSGPPGAPTVGQFFRNLIGQPLKTPHQRQPRRQSSGRPMQYDQNYAQRTSRGGRPMPPGQPNNLSFRRSGTPSGAPSGRSTRSALQPAPRKRSALKSRSDSDYASRRSRPQPRVAKRTDTGAISSRRTFESKIDDLTHPQGAVRSPDEDDINRRVSPTRPPAAKPTEPEMVVVQPRPPLIPDPEETPAMPPFGNEPDEAPQPFSGGGPNLPTTVDPFEPRVGDQHLPPSVNNEPEMSEMKAPALLVQTLGPRQIVVGKEATYRIALRNLGLVAANSAIVSVQVPKTADVAGATPTRGKVHMPGTPGAEEGIRWKIGSVAAGGKEELILKLVPRDTKGLKLAVKATSAPSESSTNIEVREPKLQLGIAGPREVNYGETVVYELTFSNPGTADAENVMVRLMPIDPGDEADVHRIGTIEAGSRQVVEIELVARQSGQLNIRAEATGDSGLKSEARRDVTVLRPELRVEMTGPKFRYARTIATYSIRVSNPGNAVAREVQLGAMLPVQATFVSCTGDGELEKDTNKVHWQLPDLQPGGEQTFKLRCELQKAGANRIQVAALADHDLRDANFVSTRVQTLADLDLDVRDPNGPVPVGEDVTYEIVITNRGSKSADNVQVLAFFSEGVEPTQVLGHRHSIQPGRVMLEPITKLAPGEETRVKIIARADTSGSHVFRAEVTCPSLNAKLTEQETTRFYSDSEEAMEGEEPLPFNPGDTPDAPGMIDPS